MDPSVRIPELEDPHLDFLYYKLLRENKSKGYEPIMKMVRMFNDECAIDLCCGDGHTTYHMAKQTNHTVIDKATSSRVCLPTLSSPRYIVLSSLYCPSS